MPIKQSQIAKQRTGLCLQEELIREIELVCPRLRLIITTWRKVFLLRLVDAVIINLLKLASNTILRRIPTPPNLCAPSKPKLLPPTELIPPTIWPIATIESSRRKWEDYSSFRRQNESILRRIPIIQLITSKMINSKTLMARSLWKESRSLRNQEHQNKRPTSRARPPSNVPNARSSRKWLQIQSTSKRC